MWIPDSVPLLLVSLFVGSIETNHCSKGSFATYLIPECVGIGLGSDPRVRPAPASAAPLEKMS